MDGDVLSHSNLGVGWLGPPSDWPVGVRGGISKRHGGLSCPPWDSLNLGGRTGDEPNAVEGNLDLLARATGLHLRDAARIRLVHGPRVLAVSQGGSAGEADGLVTVNQDLVLALTVADCYPLLLVARGRGVAIAHCGWRSAVQGIAGRAVAVLATVAGVRAGDLQAWIGPGIGACCFEVSADVAERFHEDVRRVASTSGHKPHVDLIAFLRRQLADAGIPAAGITAANQCTACNPGDYFSHRRDRGVTGRMLAWIVRDPA